MEPKASSLLASLGAKKQG